MKAIANLSLTYHETVLVVNVTVRNEPKMLSAFENNIMVGQIAKTLNPSGLRWLKFNVK